MTYRPFRFLHAAGLRLGHLPHGMAELPPHLREIYLEAVPRSAGRLIDAALTEGVDFVVLAGDLLDARLAGPRGLAVACEMFERLAEAQIDVYWLGGEMDPPDRWPDAIRLPDSIHRFASAQVTRKTHTRDGRPLVELAGANQKRGRKIKPADYLHESTSLPNIVVAHGSIDAKKLGKELAKHDTPTYWALGGRHDRDTLLSGEHVAHYCGTPQALGPEECGPRGATLVEFDQDGVFHTSFIETDGLRWCNEQFDVDARTSRDEFEEMLRIRISEVADAHPEKAVVIDWSIGGEGSLLDELRVGSWRSELIETLRDEFGHRETPLWTTDIRSAASPKDAEEHATRNTILGDFLRTLDLFDQGEQTLNLSSLVTDRNLMKSLDVDLPLAEPTDIKRVLTEARSRGIDLLGGDTNETATSLHEAGETRS